MAHSLPTHAETTAARPLLRGHLIGGSCDQAAHPGRFRAGRCVRTACVARPASACTCRLCHPLSLPALGQVCALTAAAIAAHAAKEGAS